MDIYHSDNIKNTVETRNNEVLGVMKITLLYQVSCSIRVKKKTKETRDGTSYILPILGVCYIQPVYNEVPLCLVFLWILKNSYFFADKIS